MSIVDDIIAKYTPKESNFEIKLPGGETFKFRHFSDADDFDTFQDRAAKFMKAALDGSLKKNPEMKSFVPKRGGVAIEAFMLSYLAVEPKLTELDALKLTKIPDVFKMLVTQVENARNEFRNAEFEEQVEQKKDCSSETQSEEPS